MMIDVVGQIRVEIAQRIIGKPGQVNHRIKTLEVGSFHIPQILANRGKLSRRLPKRALLEEIAVESDDLVPGPRQKGFHDRSDVALMSCDQYPHSTIPYVSTGPPLA